MGLGDTMFCGRIARRPFHRTKRSLTRNTPFKLPLNFLGCALLKRIGAAIRREACDHEQDRHAFHLHIL